VLAYWNRLFGPQGVNAGTAPPWLIPRSNPKVPASPPAKGAIEATGTYTIVIHLLVPNGAFIDQLFDSIPNWVPSPTAYQKMGETAFARAPVGTGPFTVVSDTYSSQLVVKKNPTYWEEGKPYHFQVYDMPGTSPYDLQLNTAVPPFNK
jgi:ABC-type transport system substrate-binding protein